MQTKTITIEGAPKGQPRPRFSKRGNFVQVFNPDAKLDKNIKAIIAEQVDFEIIKGAVEVDMIFYMPIGKSTSKKNRALMISNEIKHVKKYDIDNLEVKMLNCMSKIAYVDDNQVWKLNSVKLYSEKPRVEITLTY